MGNNFKRRSKQPALLALCSVCRWAKREGLESKRQVWTGNADLLKVRAQRCEKFRQKPRTLVDPAYLVHQQPTCGHWRVLLGFCQYFGWLPLALLYYLRFEGASLAATHVRIWFALNC